MTTYKNIHGKRVKTFATDLDNAEAEGQIFFSTASPGREFKTAVSSAAWSSSAPLIEGRTVAQGSAGTATAGLVCFGNPADAPYTLNETEEYNGTGWSAGGDTTHAASNASAAGTQTAAIAVGISDSPTTLTIKYDGSSWTDSGHAFPSAGSAGVASGTQTATLYSGQGSGTNSYEYDGSSWTAGGTMGTSRVGEGTGWGPQTSALMCTGRGSSTTLTSATEEYNGTSWTSTNNVNAARRRLSGSQNSTSQDSGIIFGGSPTSSPSAGATVNTEQYDGSSWTEITNLSTGRNHAGGAGNSTGAWVAGNNPNSGITEEFNVTVNTITAAAWSSGGNTTTAGTNRGTFGIQTASVSGGGSYVPSGGNPSPAAIPGRFVEEYDGTSWSEVTDLPDGTPSSGNNQRAFGGLGVLTAGALVGGKIANNTVVATNQLYDGTNWTEGGDLNTGRAYLAGMGTQTAALCAGGTSSTPSGGSAGLNESEEYDGTSWTEGDNLNTGREVIRGAGTQTAGLLYGGENPAPVARETKTESYDGSSWTEVGDMNTGARSQASFGTQTAAIAAGGSTSLSTPGDTRCEIFDGTSWASTASLATARWQHGGSGTTSAGLTQQGQSSSDAATILATEEYTPETTALNLKTITDS